MNARKKLEYSVKNTWFNVSENTYSMDAAFQLVPQTSTYSACVPYMKCWCDLRASLWPIWCPRRIQVFVQTTLYLLFCNELSRAESLVLVYDIYKGDLMNNTYFITLPSLSFPKSIPYNKKFISFSMTSFYLQFFEFIDLHWYSIQVIFTQDPTNTEMTSH